MERLKTLVLGIAVFGVLFAIIGAAGYIENHYTRSAYVCEVTDEEVIFCDGKGHEWAIDYEEGFAQGDEVKLTMFNNYTDNTLYDDVIVKVKKK